MNFCDIRVTVLLQSYLIIPGGHLQETENKRICQIYGLKFKQWSFMREVLKQYSTEKHNGYFQCGRLCEVVAYEKWLL